MATFTVTNTTDDAQTVGSLRNLLGVAVDGDTINFADSINNSTITLTSALVVRNGITIDGGGDMVVSAGGNTFANSSSGAGVFDIQGGSAPITIKDVTIDGGRATGAKGAFGSPGASGAAGQPGGMGGTGGSGGNAAGGIYVRSGTVTVTDTNFTNSTASGGQGGFGGSGGQAGTGSNTKGATGAGGTGGNAAGGIYVEPGATVTAARLTYTPDVSATAGAGGPGSTVGAAGTASQFSNDATVNAAAVCFCSGTRILTDCGEVAVEELTVGSIVVTSSGACRPIRWIGSRTINSSLHLQPCNVMPVRIAAGALGENRPTRALVVSPGHAICVNVLGEVLIPAAALVNGTTIVQEPVDSVTYWHVELDSHDLLIAEGQASESYLDMSNRTFFAGGNVVSLDATPDADAAARTHADFCRPFHDRGALVEVVRAQSRLRAKTLGWTLVESEAWKDVHLEVDGQIVMPRTRGLTASFVVPASAKDVWLISPTSIPCHVSDNPDRRIMGLCLAGLALNDGLSERKVALDDPLLCVGFHAMSPGHRWTAGRARLPADLLAGLEGSVFLRLDLAGSPLPRWVAPEADALAETSNTAPRLSLVA